MSIVDHIHCRCSRSVPFSPLIDPLLPNATHSMTLLYSSRKDPVSKISCGRWDHCPLSPVVFLNSSYLIPLQSARSQSVHRPSDGIPNDLRLPSPRRQNRAMSAQITLDHTINQFTNPIRVWSIVILSLSHISLYLNNQILFGLFAIIVCHFQDKRGRR